jgi:hypothetical protein
VATIPIATLIAKFQAPPRQEPGGPPTGVTPGSSPATTDADVARLVLGAARGTEAVRRGYLGRFPCEAGDVAREMIGLAWSSRAVLAVALLQDVLNLGLEARMNRPGSAEGNWRWRVTGELPGPAWGDCARWRSRSGRLAAGG